MIFAEALIQSIRISNSFKLAIAKYGSFWVHVPVHIKRTTGIAFNTISDDMTPNIFQVIYYLSLNSQQTITWPNGEPDVTRPYVVTKPWLGNTANHRDSKHVTHFWLE